MVTHNIHFHEELNHHKLSFLFERVSNVIYRLRSLKRVIEEMSLVMRKQAFCICENKDADQLRGNREADQRLCFRYTDSTIPLLSQ